MYYALLEAGYAQKVGDLIGQCSLGLVPWSFSETSWTNINNIYSTGTTLDEPIKVG